MIFLSPFTPIFINESKGVDGVASRQMQMFAPGDRILIEFIATGGESAPAVSVCDHHSGEVVYTLYFSTWEMSGGVKLYFTEITGLAEGCYHLVNCNVAYEPFCITADEVELAQTILFQYANTDNRQRTDAVFSINGMQRFFDFRVPGGFKAGGTSYSVDNEQFTTEYGDTIDLYALDAEVRTLTIGGGIGVPVWYGAMVNRIMCCQYVYVDGVRYARNESSTPEASQVVDNVDSFVFTQQMRKVKRLNPAIEQSNALLLRRTGGETYLASDNKQRKI